MKHTAQDVLNFAEDNDVKFVRLTFCDIFGNQKNISLFASELAGAFEHGVCFDGSSIAGFMNTEESDLVLWPDPDTVCILPWRPAEGRVMRMYCDITLPDGKPFEGNCRGYLQSVVRRASAMGLVCNVGCECEFYLFETDDRGNPTKIPFDHGGYFDIAPLDKGEDIRREICFAMEDLGLKPQHSHHESGPGQNEVDFLYAPALRSADNLNTFKSTVKAIASRNGLFASFMPKPLLDQAGSGLHVNLSLKRNGVNLFEGDIAPDSEPGHFMAGILAHARELAAFCNPVPNSYARFGSCEAPPLHQLEPAEPQPAGAAAQRPRGTVPHGDAQPGPRLQSAPGHRPDPGRRPGRHSAQAAAAPAGQPQSVSPFRFRRTGISARHPAGGHHGGRIQRFHPEGTAACPAEQVF